MYREIKIIITLLLSATVALIIYFNCGLFYSPVMVSRDSGLIMNRDLFEQLQFLKARMQRGAATEMQKIYPEGYLFMQALYGLAWCDVAMASMQDSLLYHEALDEIDWASWSTRTLEGKQVFDESLPLSYGAFYRGWSNYLLGRKLEVEGDHRDDADVTYFLGECKSIAAFFEASYTPYPESYRESAWPADAVMCAASLAVHDRIFQARYTDVLRRWVEMVKLSVDSIGLVPHSVLPSNGAVKEGSRGSSQSLMLSFLFEVDSAFARDQFTLFKKHFLDERFGLHGVREYPMGSYGYGDIDSGPVLFQIGAASSIVGIRALQTYGERRYSVLLRNEVEAFGFPIRQNGMKMFVFGKLPIADAFITWANSQSVLSGLTSQPDNGGFIRFHLYSVVIIFIYIGALLFVWRKRKPVISNLRVSE